MYLGAGGQKTAAELIVAGKAATFIPVVGPILGPTIAAIGSIVPMLSGKAHYSPWNFLYDDYPQHIWENERDIVALKNAINKIIAPGSPDIPTPPTYQKSGGQQYQASMQAIVPKYVPGSEQSIASYNRTLNEAGGAYEQTVAMQLQMIPQLQQQLQQASAQASQRQAAPAAAVPTVVPQPQPIYAQPAISPSLYQPAVYQPTVQPQYNAPTPAPISASTMQVPASYGAPAITITQPAQQAQQIVSSDMSKYLPFIIGGGVLLAVLALGKGK